MLQANGFIRSKVKTPQMTRLTFGVNVQLCSEAERTDGDVGGDPQQQVFSELFLNLFIEHGFIDADVRGERCLRERA